MKLIPLVFGAVLCSAWAPPLALSEAPGETAQPEALAPAPRFPLETGRGFVVTYFHGTIRCSTCLEMEAVAREVVQVEYAEMVELGLLEWRSVDFEVPENACFEKEYALEGSTLHFSEMDGAEVVRWEKIEGMWTHAGHPESLRPYIRGELARFTGSARADQASGEAGAGPPEAEAGRGPASAEQEGGSR